MDKAAKAVEEYVKKNEAARKEVGRIANTIIDGGKLENYGTAKAQEYLKKWAKEYGGDRTEGRRTSRVTAVTPSCLLAVARRSPRAAGAATSTPRSSRCSRKAGCNAGACHGAAAGRGGFRLSLLGGDPAADYDAIVHELEGRRVNLARPAESLLLAKPTGLLPHEGGIRLEPDGAGAKRLADWIAAGAPRRRRPRG